MQTIDKERHALDIPHSGCQENQAQREWLLSDKDKTHLLKYLKMMLLQSEGGYVLFDVKPVCLEAIPVAYRCPRNNFDFETHYTLNCEDLIKGLEAWKKLSHPTLEAKVSIVCYDQPDPPYHDCRHVIWINRAAFLNVVNQNLPLFQSILDPQVTAEQLYSKLCDPKASFSSTLAHSKVLIGIVLGFGTQNAIYASRLENIEIALREKERPPLAKRVLRAGMVPFETMQENRYLGTGMPLGDKELDPGSGFESLIAERENLQRQLELSRKIVDRSSPSIPLFHCLKNEKETARLLQQYEKAQTKIQALLRSDNFLEDTLNLLMGKPPLLKPSFTMASIPYPAKRTHEMSQGTLKNQYRELAERIGQLIKTNLLEQDPTYIETFITGMTFADRDMQLLKAGCKNVMIAGTKPILDFAIASRIQEARDNVAKGNEVLKSLAQRPGIHEIVPLKLYYKTVKSGQGPQLTVNHPQVTVHYTLSYLTGQEAKFAIASSSQTDLKTAELIPGLAHGMLGMKEGELREIYIHSDYAYGCQSNFDPGVALAASIELLHVNDKKAGTQFPPLLPVDGGIADIAPEVDENKLNQLRLDAAYAEGYCAWSFYGLGDDLYSLQDVIKSLQKADHLEERSPIEVDSTFENLLTLLYQRKERLRDQSRISAVP